MDNCATSQSPTRCRIKSAAVKTLFLMAVGVGFTALLGTGLTVFIGQ
ncbi:MAG: hypothetical protein HYU60_00830 [Magnetospirillum sp.]|nr:hypothetical protein [Magnetospirillum sp.]